jgi:hypothetical protein
MATAVPMTAAIAPMMIAMVATTPRGLSDNGTASGDSGLKAAWLG